MSTTLGPHFNELNHEAQVFLTAWLVLAQMFPPGDGEDLPVGYSRALQDLSQPHVRRRRRQRYQRVQTVRPNNLRQVRVTKVSGALA